LSGLLVKGAIFFEAGGICDHYVRAGLGAVTFLDKIGERLVHEGREQG
jgi:hypothetical protein